MIPKKLKVSIGFLTIIKIGKSNERIERDDIANSIMFFPLVGVLLGGVCALAEFLLRDFVVSGLVRSLFAVVILAVFTRGLHLDGVADCFDALHFSGQDKEKAIEVMKGKTIGAFGVSALVVVIVGKTIALYALPEELRIKSLILIPALARWTSSIVARERAPALAKGLGYAFSVYSTGKALLISGLIALAISSVIFGFKGITIFITISIFGFLLARYFVRAFGGVTGDVFGTIIELSEVFGFLVMGIVIGC
jgi:adenosylcobinamide-GDP ribazoletransferase